MAATYWLSTNKQSDIQIGEYPSVDLATENVHHDLLHNLLDQAADREEMESLLEGSVVIMDGSDDKIWSEINLWSIVSQGDLDAIEAEREFQRTCYKAQ